MLFFAVKQASGHGSKERRRALAETSDPFSVQTREWQTALLHIKWKERGEGGRREGRGRRKAERQRERGGCEGLSLLLWISGERQTTAAFAFPLPCSLLGASPHQCPSKRAARGRCGACSSTDISPRLTGELPTGPASTQAWPDALVGPRPSFALKLESW